MSAYVIGDWHQAKAPQEKQAFDGEKGVALAFSIRCRGVDEIKGFAIESLHNLKMMGLIQERYDQMGRTRLVHIFLPRRHFHMSNQPIVRLLALSLAFVLVDEAAQFAAQQVLDQRDDAGLEQWIADATASELASPAAGIGRDIEAVRAAITQPWSTSPVEGQINRLKTIKRQMYGRGAYPLLRSRLLAAA